MADSALAPLLGSEFDAFLFASIGEDDNGVSVSVVSALARLDVDPWQEAVQLAGLPRENAARRLASLIAKLPGDKSPARDAKKIALRLIALLPTRSVFPTQQPFEKVRGVVHGVNVPLLIGASILGVAILLGSLWISANLQLPNQGRNTHVSMSGAPPGARPGRDH